MKPRSIIKWIGVIGLAIFLINFGKEYLITRAYSDTQIGETNQAYLPAVQRYCDPLNPPIESIWFYRIRIEISTTSDWSQSGF